MLGMTVLFTAKAQSTQRKIKNADQIDIRRYGACRKPGTSGHGIPAFAGMTQGVRIGASFVPRYASGWRPASDGSQQITCFSLRTLRLCGE
jgi:hypothetical protein